MKSTIYDWDVKNKAVLLRIDGNVPIDQGIILNDQRLLASLPTINFLLDHHARIILLTHLGRPCNYEPDLSTRQLIPWFYDHGYDIAFADSIAKAHDLLKTDHKVILFENLRFFKEEQRPDISFAKKLSELGSYYINDAFGTMHRNDSSITLLPAQFDNRHRSIGLLVQHELEMLNTCIKHITKPSVLIIGGGKVQEKLPVIEKLLPKLSTLLLGPGLVFSFLKAEGKSIGRSLIDSSALDLCHTIIKKAESLQVSIYYPIDYIIGEKSYEGELFLIDSNEITQTDVGISIGPKTAAEWSEKILKAKTIIVNGLMGSVNRPETLIYFKDILKALSYNDKATRIVAGGDSVAAADYFNLTHEIGYISTGGGATLEYISGNQLPGLVALKDRTKT